VPADGPADLPPHATERTSPFAVPHLLTVGQY
jgi:hypothetical protein